MIISFFVYIFAPIFFVSLINFTIFFQFGVFACVCVCSFVRSFWYARSFDFAFQLFFFLLCTFCFRFVCLTRLYHVLLQL